MQTATVTPQTPAHLRAVGWLTTDAQLSTTTGNPPHMLLHMQFAHLEGLPYVARVDLGDDVADHMASEALLPHLRKGALVSVAAQATELQMEHRKPTLRLVKPHSVVLFSGGKKGAVKGAHHAV